MKTWLNTKEKTDSNCEKNKIHTISDQMPKFLHVSSRIPVSHIIYVNYYYSFCIDFWWNLFYIFFMIYTHSVLHTYTQHYSTKHEWVPENGKNYILLMSQRHRRVYVCVCVDVLCVQSTKMLGKSSCEMPCLIHVFFC